MVSLKAYTTPFPSGALWYHGSTQVFNHFASPKRYSPNEQLGFGIHLARNKDFATLYGNVIYQCRVHPLKVLNLLKPIVVGSKEDLHIGKDMFRGTGRKPYVSEGLYYLNPDIRPPRKAEAIIRKNGYDAVFYEARFGSRTLIGGYAGMNVANKTLAVVMLNGTGIEIVGRKILEKKKR